jgi:hypothetical protein
VKNFTISLAKDWALRWIRGFVKILSIGFKTMVNFPSANFLEQFRVLISNKQINYEL